MAPDEPWRPTWLIAPITPFHGASRRLPVPQTKALYTNEIHGALNYSATLLPNVWVQPGDVGELRGLEYRRMATHRRRNPCGRGFIL